MNYSPEIASLMGLGNTFDPNCMRGDNCKAQCIQTIAIDTYGLTIPGFNFTGTPGRFTDCLRYENCKPQCIDSFKNASAGAQQTEQGQEFIADKESVMQAVQASNTKTYLMVGGAVALAGVIIFIATK